MPTNAISVRVKNTGNVLEKTFWINIEQYQNLLTAREISTFLQNIEMLPMKIHTHFQIIPLMHQNQNKFYAENE